MAIFVIVVIGSGLWMVFGGDRFADVKTSEGIALLRGGTVERVQITEGTQEVRLWLKSSTTAMDGDGRKRDVGDRVKFEYVDPQADQIAELVEAANPKRGYDSEVPRTSIWSSLLTMILPIVIILGAFIFLLPRMQSGMGAFGRIRNRKQLDADKPDVTFNDVAGEDEAVAELREITEFLVSPERFHALGAKIPRGVLLYGPPGTGKTLLARAVAGEAGVPFYSISASEFVEMFVGVGASRVRDLFAKAKENAPAIVFVDEIDAVGRGRGVGIGGGNDEREQTLNQLLVELDGFDARTNVILIAATNRPDVLDPALLRPGRFDRQISVDAPDLAGRAAILAVHAKDKPIAKDVDLEMIARRTPGYTGADLANILNEAALLAARFGREEIVETDLDEAIDRVMAGPQRRSRVMNDADKLLTAYHEAGHALAAAALHDSDPVTKVTILPRGRALGYTMVLPTEDRYSVSRNNLLDQLTYAMGGRVAEEIVFHDPTTGASNDIQKATGIAWKMVTEYGMSTKVGMVRLATEDSDPMTRAMGGSEQQHSDQLVAVIDAEVRLLVDAAHREAWSILTENRRVLDALAARLIEKETVLETELGEIFADVVKAPKRQRWYAFDVPEDMLAVTEVPPIAVAARTGDGTRDGSRSGQIGQDGTRPGHAAREAGAAEVTIENSGGAPSWPKNERPGRDESEGTGAHSTGADAAGPDAGPDAATPDAGSDLSPDAADAQEPDDGPAGGAEPDGEEAFDG
ncbi:MAG: ATP-dependent zinc metalloprotease FtsH [Actinomycetaceae bacterium]|nr:ATP-dependent zinc metalloprotease FtsH [Actinomycetaceae bacterium]